MKLTDENKAYIDSLTHYDLLRRWRFAPIGDPWFQDETGKYWGECLEKKRAETPFQAVGNSKNLG